MEKLAALDDGKARTIQHVADAILHHVFQFTGQNPEMDRVALAAYGAELVALGNGLSQRIERGHPKRTLEGELRKQAMMGHGKPPCCRDWRRQREVRGTPGHRTAKRPACRTAGEPIYAVNRTEEHTSELQSLMRIQYDVFSLKKTKCTCNCVHIPLYSQPSL